MRNPLSLVELSAQVRSTRVLLTATAFKLAGPSGGLAGGMGPGVGPGIGVGVGVGVGIGVGLTTPFRKSASADIWAEDRLDEYPGIVPTPLAIALVTWLRLLAARAVEVRDGPIPP